MRGTLRVEVANDADGVVIADAIMVEKARDDVIDDGDAGYCERGGRWWSGSVAGGYGNDYRCHRAGKGDDVAMWRFDGLEAGRYRVWTTWISVPNRAMSSPFTLRDGDRDLGTIRVNQQRRPVGERVYGLEWEELGAFTVKGGSLVVELSDNADGFVVVDAVRIEHLK